MSVGHLRDTVAVPCVLMGKKCLYMFGLSEGRGKGVSSAHWLLGSSIGGWLVLLFVP